MNTKFRVQVRAMSETEVMDMVPARVLASIKAENHKPVFKAFVVGQEGEARPRIVGIGSVVQKWYRSAIQALGDKLKIGTPVFNLHAPTNTHDGRTPIGEIVGKAIERIENAVSVVAVAYIYPEYQDLKLDVASVEAEIMVPADSRKQGLEDSDIMKVTGVALGNSAINTPAFPGATLLATLQAFAESNKRTPGGSATMTLDDIKQAIQQAGFKPSDVFDGKALTSDPFIIGHVKDEKGNEYYARKRNQAEFEEEREKWAKEKKALEDQVRGFQMATLKTSAATTLETVLKSRQKLAADEKFSKFLKKSFEKSFTPGEAAALEKDVSKFVDSAVDDFKDLFGEPGKDAPPAGDGKDKGGAPGAGADDAGTAKAGDMTDPTKNDLIPS